MPDLVRGRSIRKLARHLSADAEGIDRGGRGIGKSVLQMAEAGLLAQAARQPPQGWLFDTLFALGGASLPAARLFEGHVDALGLVDRCGGLAARTLARDVAEGGGLLGVWGADAPGAAAVAEIDANGTLRLRGAKAFASGLGCVALAVVTARDPEAGTRLLLVEASDPVRQDAGSWDMDGMVGSASGRFDLAGLRVPPAMQLGGPGALVAEPYFHGGLWRICAAQAGALDALARLLAAHIDERGQGDEPLQRWRLAQLVLAAGTARLWAERAADVMGPTARIDAIETVLFAREAVERAAVEGLEQCERAAGTAMHQRGSAMGRLARDLRLYLRQATLDAKLDYALKLWSGRRDRGNRDKMETIEAEQPVNPFVGDGSGQIRYAVPIRSDEPGQDYAAAVAGDDRGGRTHAGLPAGG